MEQLVFWLFAALAVGSALVVVTHRNPVYSVMSLVVALFSTAVLFVLLGAPFLAALVVLVYAGAILVLFLFVLMLLNVGRERVGAGGGLQRVAAIAASVFFSGLVAMLVWRQPLIDTSRPLSEDMVAVERLAALLFSRYLLPFEIVGLLLLAAVIAATVLARKPPAQPGVRGEGSGIRGEA